MIKPYPEGTDARFLQDHPMAGLDLYYACKTALAYLPNPLHPARQQLQAAIDLVDMRHAPRRPIADLDILRLKQSGELERRRFEQAMRLQHQQQDVTGRSL